MPRNFSIFSRYIKNILLFFVFVFPFACTKHVKNKHQITQLKIELFDVVDTIECLSLEPFSVNRPNEVVCLNLRLYKKFVVDKTTSVRTLFPSGIKKGIDGRLHPIKKINLFFDSLQLPLRFLSQRNQEEICVKGDSSFSELVCSNGCSPAISFLDLSELVNAYNGNSELLNFGGYEIINICLFVEKEQFVSLSKGKKSIVLNLLFANERLIESNKVKIPF